MVVIIYHYYYYYYYHYHDYYCHYCYSYLSLLFIYIYIYLSIYLFMYHSSVCRVDPLTQIWRQSSETFWGGCFPSAPSPSSSALEPRSHQDAPHDPHDPQCAQCPVPYEQWLLNALLVDYTIFWLSLTQLCNSIAGFRVPGFPVFSADQKRRTIPGPRDWNSTVTAVGIT